MYKINNLIIINLLIKVNLNNNFSLNPINFNNNKISFNNNNNNNLNPINFNNNKYSFNNNNNKINNINLNNNKVSNRTKMFKALIFNKIIKTSKFSLKFKINKWMLDIIMVGGDLSFKDQIEKLIY